MPQAVVEDLEAVDVDKQNSELEIRVAPRSGQGPPEAVEEESAIRQVGQAIVECTMRKHLLGAFAIGYVPVHNDEPLAFAV